MANLSNAEEPPLVFVYLGNAPPRFTRDSLIFASGGHSGKVILLTDVDADIQADHRYSIVRINNWYDPSRFDAFRTNASLDAAFMGGFWYHVVERFFVLEQYMKMQELDSLFHAELDVMIFDLHGVKGACDATGTGIFAVMDDPSRALASLFYVNDLKKFGKFLDFAQSDLNMRNEMEMIGRFIQTFPDTGHALPSNPYFEERDSALAPSQVSDSVGLFDSNTFGHWLLGLDPKTIKYESRNHFRNEMVRFPIENLRFRLGLFGRRLMVALPGKEPRQLRTLHVHSKIVSRLRFRPVALYYLWLNTLERRSIVTHKKGWWASRVLDQVLGGGPVWNLLRMAQGLARRSIVGLVIWLAARGAVPMPNKQRARLNSLLPLDPFQYKPAEQYDLWVLPGKRSVEEVEALIEGFRSDTAVQKIRAIVGPECHGSFRVADAGPGLEVRAIDTSVQHGLALDLFHHSAPRVVVIDCETERSSPRVFFSGGRQILVLSEVKADSARRHSTNFLRNEDFTYECDFSEKTQVYQTENVRAVFGNSQQEIEKWSKQGVSKSAQPSLAQLYGSWMWNTHRKYVRLAQSESK